MTTLICQVAARWPVANVSAYGTLDLTSAPRLMVCMRDALADGPSAVIVDVAHLVVAADAALVPVIGLAGEAERWPGATIAFCGADAEVTAAARRAGFADKVPLLDAAAAADLTRNLPLAQRRTLALRPGPSAPSTSREFTSEVCAEWGLGRVTGLAELIVSELVTNAVLHARTEIGMTLRLSEETLSIAVRDRDMRPMAAPSATTFGAPTDEHGRGLLLLDAMADAWGSTPTADGKVVWASIGIRRGRPRGGESS
jgi:anti-sigma regulatory factor (Ser/Thr protein kinase)